MRISFLLPVILVAIAAGLPQGTTDKPPVLTCTSTTPPIPLNGINARFCADISYNSNSRSVFDIFMPTSGTPTAAIIFLHGGGFTSGDKSNTYDNDGAATIREYLQNNIAFIAANYQFMQDDPSQGLYTSLKDIRRCLQFIRYYSASFNIKKAKMAAYGGSAGGGASIWLAFHPNTADSSATEPLLRESTRLVAAGHSTSQASYDPVVIQAMFAATGIDNYYSMRGVTEQIMYAFVITSLDQLQNDPRVVAMRKDVDMLGLMSADDPEFYTQTDNPIITPQSAPEANHVPLHAKALVTKAQRIGLGYKARIPAYGIDTTAGETMQQFLIRKLS